jgi:hypothetical protein
MDSDLSPIEKTQDESGGKHWPKPLGEDAYIGFAGEFVLAVMKHTEADPAALLFQLLVCFGNCIGTNPFYRQEWTRHHARESVLIVGRSAKARKGTSWNIIKEIFKLADANWFKKRIVSGLGSGEGVVNPSGVSFPPPTPCIHRMRLTVHV